MRSQRPTVADILALKGRRQLTMLRVETLEEAEAAERAGVDMLSVPPALLSPEFRDAAPSAFAVPGLEYGDFITAEEYIRAAFKALRAGGDAVYCAASLATVRSMRNEGIPVCGHVGLIPSQATWTGGFKAVGKTAESAFRGMAADQSVGRCWRIRSRNRSCACSDCDSNFRAHISVHDFHGRRRGLRCAVPVRARCSWLESWPLSASRQDLSQLQRRI